MIARCFRCGNVFVPRSVTPRCPECHAQKEAHVFMIDELRPILDSYFQSSPPANREPGDAPSGAGPSGLGHGTGDDPQGGASFRAPSGHVASGVLPQSLPPDPARAEGGEDDRNETVETATGSRAHPPDPVSFSEPAVDVGPIKSQFFERGWDRATSPEQRLLLKDALRAAGIAELDELQVEEMREAWLEEKAGRIPARISAETMRRVYWHSGCDWLLETPGETVRICGARAIGRCAVCGRRLCGRHRAVHARKNPDHPFVQEVFAA